MGRSRSRRARRTRRHVRLAVASGLLTGLLAVVFGFDYSLLRGLSIASGYAALMLLAATLMIGPLNVLRGRPNPVSSDLRRDLGIWAGILALAHVVVGLQAHFRGAMWKYFLYELPNRADLLPLRTDVFGLANHAGLLATFIVMLLLALSNDLSLRRLGTRRWKLLHRSNYFYFLFTVLHAVAFQFVQIRRLPLLGLLGLTVAATVTVQLTGFSRVRRRARVEERQRVAAPWL